MTVSLDCGADLLAGFDRRGGGGLLRSRGLWRRFGLHVFFQADIDIGQADATLFSDKILLLSCSLIFKKLGELRGESGAEG